MRHDDERSAADRVGMDGEMHVTICQERAENIAKFRFITGGYRHWHRIAVEIALRLALVLIIGARGGGWYKRHLAVCDFKLTAINFIHHPPAPSGAASFIAMNSAHHQEFRSRLPGAEGDG